MLRSMWRHEQMAIKLAVAEKLHHSACRPVLSQEELVEHAQYNAPRGQKTARAVGAQPAPLSEVAGWQERVQRHAVEHLADLAPLVQILDAPVPQMVDNVMYAFRLLDRPIAEQVIEVPKISCSPCPSRVPILVPQMAEQLVGVPTVLTPTRIALRIAEQIVNTPVPRRRGQGFLPEQSSTATSSYLERISERTVAQIVDISPSGVGLGQGSSSSARSAEEDFSGFFFALFHMEKGQVSADLPRHVSSWTLAAYEDLEAADEPAELEEDAELFIEEEEDPSGWFVSFAASGRPYYWHRSSRRSVWHLPHGASARKKKGRRKRKKRRKRRLASSSSPAVAYAGLVLLVPFSRSFLRLAAGPSCQASWMVWTRWTVSLLAVVPGSGQRVLLVLYLALCLVQLFQEAAKIGRAVKVGTAELGLTLSCKSTLLANSKSLGKLIVSHLETDGVPICLGTAATDLGIETAAGKRRCAASQWKRIWKGRRRAKRVKSPMQDELRGAKAHDDRHSPCSNLRSHSAGSIQRTGRRHVQKSEVGKDPSMPHHHSRMVFRSQASTTDRCQGGAD